MDKANIGIEQIGTYTPEHSLDPFELGERFEANAEFIETKLGFKKLARKAVGDQTTDLCVRAFEDLTQKHSVDLSEIECLMLVTQNPDEGGIPHSSAILHQKLGLPRKVACCDISLGCTGYVHSLSVIVGFMRENGMEKGLLFTCDPYSTIMAEDDRDTMMLFGDGSTCSLVSTSPKYCMGKSRYLTDSRFYQAIRTEVDQQRTLKMKGNEVFRFVARNLPKEIKGCLADNGLTVEQVDAFLVHQGSKYIVETLSAALDVGNEKMKFEAGSIGNTVSSSLPMMIADLLAKPEPPSDMLIAGFGVGLSSFVSTLHLSQNGE